MMFSINSAWQNLTRTLEESSMASLLMEIFGRALLFVIFLYAEFSMSETHVIQPEDMWRYRYPLKDSKVPFGELVVFILLSSAVVFYLFGRGKKFHGVSECGQATLGFTCSMFVTGVITNILKSVVGRPRPNYLIRCYGPVDYLQVRDSSSPCISSDDHVGDLRKSFPSGHSSVAFSSFVYLSLYMAGKLGTFNSRGRGCMWRVLVSVFPIFLATYVAATRYTDYHHHFDDILAGSILGAMFGYLSYRAYYPPLDKEFSEYPYKWLNLGILAQRSQSQRSLRTYRKPYSKPGMEVEDRVTNEPLISSMNLTSPRSSERFLSFTDNNPDIRISIRRLPSANMNNPEISTISRASIAFDWSQEDLDENGQPLLTPSDVEAMRQEILAALANLNRSSQNLEVNGN